MASMLQPSLLALLLVWLVHVDHRRHAALAARDTTAYPDEEYWLPGTNDDRHRQRGGASAMGDDDDDIEPAYKRQTTVFNAAGFRNARAFAAQTTSCVADPSLCGSHGRCAEGVCICLSNSDEGYWTHGSQQGATCSECQTGWAGSDCRTECRGGSCNACNGHGTCNEGSTGDGSCTCFNDAVKGFWSGVACTACADNYFGSGCNTPCPGVELTAEACFGRGTCESDVLGAGSCRCEEGWGAATGCFECDDAHYGPTCLFRCEGYVPETGKPCSGHGRCFNGTTANGTCVCDPGSGYGTRDCSVQCPNLCTGTNGECLEGAENDATCVCKANFALPDCQNCVADRTGDNCEIECDVGPNGFICSGNGNCTYDPVELRRGCSCASGWTGAQCQMPCPGSPPCSGHGTCISYLDGRAPTCECFKSPSQGYWAGDSCDRCQDWYNRSLGCNIQCPPFDAPPGTLPCNGHGQCVNGRCYCERGLNIEYCGVACAESSPPGATSQSDDTPIGCNIAYCPNRGIFGSSCNQRCPGRSASFLSDSCNGNGWCDEGRQGSGICTCKADRTGAACDIKCTNNTAGVVCSGFQRGICSFDPSTQQPYCKCRPEFAGPACEIDCALSAGLVCGGHGTCRNTHRGDGTCQCDRGWTGPRCDVPCLCNEDHGTCNSAVCGNLTSAHTCSVCVCNGNFTGMCNTCRPGTQGANCEGECVNGKTVGRTCQCEQYWSTPSCTVPCPRDNVTGVICSGNGTCIWGETQSGECSCFPAGEPAYFGRACQTFCTPERCRMTTPFLNPQCNNATGACECQDNAQGHWAGDVCAECKRGFWGPACKEECQCSGHGSCDINTGECQCFSSSERGFYSGQNCDVCAGGYIGQNCERRNAQITRLQRLNETDAELDAPPAALAVDSSALPMPTVLMVDSSRRALIVGGVPVYMFDIATTTMRELASSRPEAIPGAPTPPPGSAAAAAAACAANLEVAFSWLVEDSTFFLMQPNPACSGHVRILMSDSRDGTVDLNSLRTIWKIGDTETINFRVRAATTAQQTDRESGIVSFLLVRYTRGGGLGAQLPGGWMYTINAVAASAAAQGSSAASAAVARHQLSTSLHAFAIAASLEAIDTTDETQTTVVAIGGMVAGSWELVLLRRGLGVDFEPLLVGTDGSMVAQVDCWPVVGSAIGGGGGAAAAIGSATTTCESCMSIDTLVFVGKKLIAAMHVALSPTANTTIMMEFEPFFAVPTGTAVWYRLVDDQPCAASRYVKASDEVYSLTRVDVRRPVTHFYTVSVSGTDEEGAQASSMAVDIAAQVIYVALDLRSVNRPSILSKFALFDNFTLYGKRQLNYISTSSQATAPEVFSAMVTDPDARLLYAIVRGTSQLRIVTFLLYEVFSITPDIADQRGGTVITITGLGFKQLRNVTTNEVLYPPACQFAGKSTVEATNISFTTMECRATENDNVSTTTAACEGQTTEVSLYGDTWWTESEVTLKRVQSPRVDRVTPDRGGLEGGTRLTIAGQGFVQSPYATCLFWSDNPLATERLSTPLTYVTPNVAECTQPAATEASFDNSFVNVSVDGQLYADQGPVPYQIVGDPANLSTAVVASRAAVARTRFTINVSIVDSQGHALGRLDKTSKSVCILPNITSDECDPAAFSWRSEDDGYPWPPCRNNTLRFVGVNDTLDRLCRWTTDGVASFDDIVFDDPRASSMVLTFHAEDMRQYPWITEMPVVISEGTAHALAIANREDLIDVTIVNSQALTPPPEIIVIDALGNVLTSTSSSLVVAAQTSYVMDSTGEVELTNSYTLTQRQDGNRIRFNQIFMKYVHGATHYIDFTSDPPLVPTQSPPIRTSLCDNPSVSYKVVNASECQPCPPEGAVCNGTELIRVLPGFWRGNTSTAIYRCPAGPFVCLGSAELEGSNCAHGYKGPLCSQCIAGYGKAGATSCIGCEPFAVSMAYLVGGAVVFLTVLLIWTTVTLRAAEVTDLTVIMRTVVNHMQATGKLGEFSTQWSPFLKDVFAWQDSASSVSVSGLSSLDCVLRESNQDYYAVFVGYMMLPLVSVIMAIGVFIVVRFLKMKPIISEELESEIREDVRSMGINARTAILLQRYPLYMVVTTTLCVNMFAMYQTLITQSTTVLQCRTFEVEDGVKKSYLDVDTSIECDENGNHKFRTAAMLCAITYGFGIPTAFYFGYKFMNGRIGKPALTRMMFMFLIGGYQNEYWYWQAIIMVRKMLLVLIIVFVGDNTQLQSYCGMWAMSVALIIQIWFQPNSKHEFNLVEALSLAVITITLNLGLLYFWPAMPEFGRNALTATLILITLGAVCMFGYFIYGPIKSQIQEVLTTAVGAAKTLREKAANLGAEDSDEEEEKKMFRTDRDDALFEDDDFDEDGLDSAGLPTTGRGRLTFERRDRGLAAEPNFEAVEETAVKLHVPERTPQMQRKLARGGMHELTSPQGQSSRSAMPTRFRGGRSSDSRPLARAEYEAL